MNTSEARGSILDDRKRSIRTKGRDYSRLNCETGSLAGVVSQRACVYSGARVVLNPISDAVHLVHGPIGCSSYTWDIRGSLSSGSELNRFSFSTDLRERDVIFGGEKKLAACIDELVDKYHPPLLLVYSTCLVGVIGDDLESVCRQASRRHGIDILPVQSSGFAGTKKDGYRAACEVLLRLMETGQEYSPPDETPVLNYLGDFNLAGEAWIIRSYLEEIGIRVNLTLTGDSTAATIKKASRAHLNIIQCAGSMHYLAQQMQERYGIPCFNVSFLGLEDTASSLRQVVQFFDHPELMARAEALIERERSRYLPEILACRLRLEGKKAAIYVGGGYKAVSLIKQFRELGMEVVMVGTQTGREDEYQSIMELARPGTVVLDDANPSELEAFLSTQGADLLVGGVKERPLAYKLGLAFIDHNHDRKHPLAGFVGAANFARELCFTVCSPVWKCIGER